MRKPIYSIKRSIVISRYEFLCFMILRISIVPFLCMINGRRRGGGDYGPSSLGIDPLLRDARALLVSLTLGFPFRSVPSGTAGLLPAKVDDS